MIEIAGYDWLSESSQSFVIAHNAHRETHTTVYRHLLHRQRLGDVIEFGGDQARAHCEQNDEIWELSLRLPDGTMRHFAGQSLGCCLSAASAAFSGKPRLAA